MTAVADATAHLLPGQGTRELTAEERACVEDILDAAAEWGRGRMSLGAFARTGWMANGDGGGCGYGRFVAVRVTPADDPRRVALLREIDEMVRLEGWVITRQGLFSAEERTR